ncbi:GntR family transcriptional regulator [uncultured Sneathiella sp.]|jgi:DNA-binding GntR family transcriptional regulator|uniref:GntR family transcriptional regulator n=1 Tax=uncultured Sneathiella sp. TaxID=879315 RepID=UPI0030D7FA0C|tara:strand:- start:15728 stop:16426 length:699 start_codon:yes stop_codon:yes gene_type:complete
MTSKNVTNFRGVESSSKPPVSDTDRLVDELRRRIVTNQMPPGSRIRENELAEEFNVSRSRVRDAFGILEERGLIERIPNKGAVVMRLEADSFLELFDVREVLEGLMVRLATQNTEPDYWDDLIELFGDDLEKAVAENDFNAYMAAIAEFRQSCIDAAGSGTLRGLLDDIYDRVLSMTRRLMLVPGRASEGFRQHREILQAMRAGDVELAEDLKRNNIRSARQWFLKYNDFLL